MVPPTQVLHDASHSGQGPTEGRVTVGPESPHVRQSELVSPTQVLHVPSHVTQPEPVQPHAVYDVHSASSITVVQSGIQ